MTGFELQLTLLLQQLRTYRPPPDEQPTGQAYLIAPPAWPEELALIAAGAALTAYSRSVRGWRASLLHLPGIIAASSLLGELGGRWRRRSARRLGLTAATAPRAAVAYHLPGAVAIGVSLTFMRWLLRAPRPPTPWWFYLAARIVAAVNERRSWRRAYRP